MKSIHKKQLGLTLIELLIALVLGLVLMAGTMQLFSANNRSYQLSQEISRMQEGANYALFMLERDLRMAGFLGCTGRDRSNIVINNLLAGAGSTFTIGNGVEGWEASGSGYGSYTPASYASVADASGAGWSSSGATTPVLDDDTFSVAGSDVVRVWHVEGNGSLSTVAGLDVTATTTPPYAANDIMMLSKCSSIDVAQVCGMSGDTADLDCASNSGTLRNTDGAHAYKLLGKVYFVGKRGNVDTNPPALYRREIGANATAGAPQELVEGVESIQLTYGEDTDTTDPDGIANRYVTASSVSDWTNVVSIRVHLLMQSDAANIVDGSQTFRFNGADVTGSDGRLRYPFMATISLRNRSQ